MCVCVCVHAAHIRVHRADSGNVESKAALGRESLFVLRLVFVQEIFLFVSACISGWVGVQWSSRRTSGSYSPPTNLKLTPPCPVEPSNDFTYTSLIWSGPCGGNRLTLQPLHAICCLISCEIQLHSSVYGGSPSLSLARSLPLAHPPSLTLSLSLSLCLPPFSNIFKYETTSYTFPPNYPQNDSRVAPVCSLAHFKPAAQVLNGDAQMFRGGPQVFAA